MLKRWNQIRSKIVYKNPWWTYKRDAFQITDGVAGEYHYVHTEGSSMIMPFTGDGRVLLVKQYRYLCQRESIEFPCGSVKTGQTYLETAHRELAEETGFRAIHMQELGEFNPYNGVTNEICKVFLARKLEKSMVTPDETEEFELLHCSPDEIDSMIAKNTIWDGMTLAAWMIGRTKPHSVCP